MAAQTLDNVVAFNEARANRGSHSAPPRRAVKPESVGVINDCRDMALSRICAALSSTFDKIEDELFELAGKSADRETQNMYLDARTQSREKRQQMEAVFRSQFVSFFEKKVAGVDANAKTGDRVDMSQLSLVEDDALTENIAVNDIAKRLTNKCDEELRALSQRMGFLLSEPELADEGNPISPDNIVNALKAACDQLTAGFQTKLTVMKMVEQHMAQEMLTVYHDLNTHLVARQILPILKPTFRRADVRDARRGGQQAASAAHGDEHGASHTVPSVAGGQTSSGHAAGVDPAAFGDANLAGGGGFGDYSAARLGMPPANQASELFQTLQRLMAGGASFADGTLPPSAAGTQEYSSFITGNFAPVPPRNGGASRPAEVSPTDAQAGSAAREQAHVGSGALIAALSQVQQHWQQDSGRHAAYQAVQNFVPGETDVTSLNVLREIKSQGLTQGSNQVDAMTIDIVAMLFDYVFDDKAIPDTIKALIARLQIPVLKVAIIDKTFFSKKSHPVRRLLDTLADASVAFAGEASRDDPLYKQIESIVNRIHEEFETDVSLFEKMIIEFAGFLRARETANAEVVEQSARAMHEREKREMARMVAQAECERQIEQSDLPPPVAAMIKGPWARVLERVYLRDGGRSARFNDAIETAEQLVWSVKPKIDGNQRRDLVAALPLLLKRLQDGLDVASVDASERGRFFTALVDCHAVAVKAGLRGESVSALFAATHKDDAIAPLFEKLIAEEHARGEAASNINRSGVARIQFTDNGVEIEEVMATREGATTSKTNARTQADDGVENALMFENGPATPEIPPPELKRGTWVEFVRSGGEKVRAKLSWISPLKGVYLFTNPGATEALSIAPDALQRQLARGSARVLEASSLIDRAVDRMVSSLGGATAS
jgi:hypothetical protein